PTKHNFTLTGTIFDATNGERIPYATVLVRGTTRYAAADATGYFILESVPSDTATIIVQYLGYQTAYVQAAPALTIELTPQPQTIAEVFITGRKDDKALQQSTGEHKMKMSPIALKVLPNIGERDVMRGFQLMPGVSAANENSSGMYVRGGTPDQNLIVYDGFTVYYVDHLHGFYSAFNANAVKDVQLYKGGFESKYGGRLSSVTEITGKDGNAKNITVGGEANLLSVNAYAEAPIGDKFTSLLAFRRSYQGYLYKKISGQSSGSTAVGSSATVASSGRMPQGMTMTVPESYFYDVNAKLTYHPTKRDIVSLSFFNGTDYVDNTPQFSFGGGGMGGGGMGGGMGGGFDISSISMDNADYERYGNIGASLRHARKWNEKLTSSTIASFSNFYSTRDQTRTITRNDTTSRSGNLEDNDLLDLSLKSDWKYSLNDWNIIEAGVFATAYDIRYTYAQSADTTLLDKQNEAVLGGIFLQDKIKLANAKLTLTPGLRLSYFSLTSKLYAEPRLSANYALPLGFTLNAATGLYYQFANRVVREDVMSGNTDFWILSNGNDIPVSSSRHLNLGLNYDLPNYLFSVEGYYKLNENLSEYTLRFDRMVGGMGGRPGGPGGGGMGGSSSTVSEQFFTGNGYSIGLELLAQRKAGVFSGWISYTLAEVKNRFPDQSSKYFYAYQDVTHELKAVGIYKFGDFDFSACFIYSTGRPYTAPLGAYVLSGLNGAAMDFYAVSDKNTFRLPDYIRLDFAASWRFDHFWSKGKPNAISLSLFNALNRRNVSAKQFQVLDGAILESNISYLGITPNLSLVFKF
ncbi:MAG: TonB-dependent receptor, partial [Prevotellaceae bacterium]|nr:TonB-dependent receptor [Prevotellaceae bacterium]